MHLVISILAPLSFEHCLEMCEAVRVQEVNVGTDSHPHSCCSGPVICLVLTHLCLESLAVTIA